MNIILYPCTERIKTVYSPRQKVIIINDSDNEYGENKQNETNTIIKNAFQKLFDEISLSDISDYTDYNSPQSSRKISDHSNDYIENEFIYILKEEF